MIVAMICRGEVGRGTCPPPASTLIPAGQAAREMVG
jgi:hypothetical protein